MTKPYRKKATDHPLANPGTPFALFMKELARSRTQVSIANALGISEAEVSNLVAGKRMPSASLIKRFRLNMPEVYPAALYAADKTVGAAMPFELTEKTIMQQMTIFLLSLLWDQEVDDEIYKEIRNIIARELIRQNVLTLDIQTLDE